MDATTGLDEAIEAFEGGEHVLVHDFDDPESETDMIYPAAAVSPFDVARLRNEAGGWSAWPIEDSVADTLDLPFMHDVIDHPSSATTKVEYDNRSAFSLPVNHRDCYTGVTDDDRALTINRLADIAKYPSGLRFASEFQIPGHVHLLRGAPGLLSDRQGHTELGLVLAQHANVATAVVICEMLDDESGKSVTKEDAKAYANARDILFLDGHEIVTLLSSSDAADSSEAVGHSH